VGRRDEALASTEEAVALYRELAEASPAAYLPDLAMALNNLGAQLSEVGRRDEALASTEEAVALYRELAEASPAAYLPDLAIALNNLGNRLADRGLGHMFDSRWQSVVEGLDDEARAVLLVNRARRASSDGPAIVVAWLAEALELAPESREVVGEAHHVARSLRTPNHEAMDAVWRSRTHTEPPAWLTVDLELLALAEEWVRTPTFTAERDYLAEHPVLLQEAADIPVGEALLPLPPDEAERLRRLRQAAQQVGVTGAYQPLLLTILAWEFARADATQRRQLLEERGDELLDPLVHEALQAAPEEEWPIVAPALALLTVAMHAHELLPPVLDAIDAPDAFAALFEQSTTSEVLYAVTIVALSAAVNEPQAATALFWQAIAQIEAGDRDAAVATLTAAFTTDPGQRDQWIALLAARGAQRPAVLALVPILVALNVENGS
jgi:tetratricopeptide (TPR) repeat protein